MAFSGPGTFPASIRIHTKRLKATKEGVERVRPGIEKFNGGGERDDCADVSEGRGRLAVTLSADAAMFALGQIKRSEGRTGTG